ncbi:GTP cyclohydrolase II [Ferruginivarius sediminum]|uniref:GTP cyclohydrolase-2 n=1 Tax=Ferruginivarius sediminum TaxID=2661937 RepID=A0A369T981_9PROT|nr:GTP cyclohydrolase II [Ferruginivarius sediminum]RDD61891.1 GTP cyclohydrolase II [Ferruginivarius sediminum]
MGISAIETLIDSYGKGGIGILQVEGDSDDGYLILAAEAATPEALAFISTHGRGRGAIGLSIEQLEAVANGTSARAAPDFLLEGEAAFEAGSDNQSDFAGEAGALRALADGAPQAGQADLSARFTMVRVSPMGVMTCPTPVEAAIDLSRIAGGKPAAVVRKLRLEAGPGKPGASLDAFATAHGLPRARIGDVIAHRRRAAPLRPVEAAWGVRMPTQHGEFRAYAFEDPLTHRTHVAFIMGEIAACGPVLARLHSECLTGDVMGSMRCDCGEQLAQAMEAIAQAGQGVVLYLRQEGRGIGLSNKLRAYALQDGGLDTVDANTRLGFPIDLRDFGMAAQMLRHLEVGEIRLLTNNAQKVASLEEAGIRVAERVPLLVSASPENEPYLNTKRTKLGHLLLATSN